MRDIRAYEEQVPFFEKANSIPDKPGSFTPINQNEFVFFMEMPWFVKKRTLPLLEKKEFSLLSGDFCNWGFIYFNSKMMNIAY